MSTLTTVTLGVFLLLTAPVAAAQKRLLWGDTHLHSSYSADAYLQGNFTAGPATAYRYAMGQPVIHPFHRARVQIDQPLDFLVVSDHAEFFGGIRQIHRVGVDTTDMGTMEKLAAWGVEKLFAYLLADGYGMDAFQAFTSTPMDPSENAAELLSKNAPAIPGQAKIMAATWGEATRLADEFNRPGKFSAIIGWEWTSTPGGANLHRVVLTDGNAESATGYLPFSRDDSPYPEDLWAWLEKTSENTGDRFIAIPHNSNVSKGYMFPLRTLRGEDFSPRYLALRSRWEPVVEATQTKGDSETHPRLSPADALADFERYGYYIQAYHTPYRPGAGDYVRSALQRGLHIGREKGINPYRFGLIGSTDSHTGLSSPEESNFLGGEASDAVPGNKSGDSDDDGNATGWDMSASGLAAVWARDNTREAIIDALQQREVYATTGPRIVVRLDAGWSTTPAGSDRWSVEESPKLVPMGSTLPAAGQATQVPTLYLHAMKDPDGANLDRIQVIKGWIDQQGESHERVFDAAWSGTREPDGDGRIGPVGNTVDPLTASYDNSIGVSQLTSTWRDTDFDPDMPAFYYVRVLEIPTPRHSLYDAVALGRDSDPWPASLQERAYTSPIWYQPPTGRP